MKKIALYLFIISVASEISFLSCKKEISCEGCINGNKPPTAIAGPDQAIILPTDSILLDGSASNDPDGMISEWLWKKISGPASFAIVNAATTKTVVRDLDTGAYLFELFVKDNGGLTAKDTMHVIVNSTTPINRPPIAKAGPDQMITLPTNIVTLDGSNSTDPDNNITNYQWTKIVGPPSLTIANVNAVQTQATNLIQDTYQFELKVTDAGGLIGRDTMQVTVKPETNPSLVDIYVAGMQNDLPVYWKNGQSMTLDNNAWNFTGSSIAVTGGDVYVAGSRNGLMYTEYAAKYWKNSQGTPLGNYAGATSIAVVGSDVYVAGWEIEGSHYVAKYWKNGQAIALTNGNMDAYASSIVVVGDDVYVAGQEGNVAKYWKNGQVISLTIGVNQSYANSITVVGSDIYVAGSETNGSSHHVAKYWKNGQAVSLTNGNNYATATSIAVVGSDVYVAGWEGDFYGMVGGSGSVAKYWKNGQVVPLTSGTTYAYTGSVAIFEGDVYVAGYEIVGGQYQPKYWKNGSATSLSNGPGGGWAASIVVVRR
jgi:hypothetical protein